MRGVDYQFPERMGTGDLGAALELTRVASWNQLKEDWEAFMELGRLRCAKEPGGRIVATIGLLPLGRTITWISLVLVLPEHRGRGLASRMMHWAVERAREEGWTAMLDATEAGSHVYRKIGFKTTDRLCRCVLDGVGESAFPGKKENLFPMTAGDVTEAAAWEQSRCGLERRDLMASWLRGGKVRGWLTRDAGGRISGFSLSRPGHKFPHLGPVHAENPESFRGQIQRHLAVRPGPLLMDLTARGLKEARETWEKDLRVEREFLRMGLGGRLPSIPEGQYAIAGPEFG
ncbi:MAG TPA: GNAT family N-acetyltransferase [Oceanipulchritudo sp.]|nr:GNAT family N-acetyltransferase [Oceanipulchritudo sp.]